SISIITDNESAARDALNTSDHPMQISSVRCCANIRAWLMNNNENRLRISWCPSHKGIRENERADELTRKEGDVTSIILSKLFSTYSKRKSEVEGRRDNEWRILHEDGSQWMTLKMKNKKFGILTKGRQKKIVKAVEDDAKKMSRLTRAITNHAPHGEYRRRFFPDKNDKCDTCGTLQSRYHILQECDKYLLINKNYSFSRTNSSFQTLVKFLDKNEHSFTFEDAPFDPP
ncbi:hypothetical protein M378DRAFT_83866, partial [Amanita muscaria Koide BX008]